MGVVILLLVCVILVLAIKLRKAKSRPASGGPSTLTQSEIAEKIYQRMDSSFRSLGWTEWDGSIHRAAGQYERMERAATSRKMELKEYDRLSDTAVVSGDTGEEYIVTGHGCTCMDFRARSMPCKHMYFLAMEKGEYQ